MAKYITMSDLATMPRKIFDKVQNGETLIVLRHNRPVAALVPLTSVEEDLSAWSLMLENNKQDEL